MNIALLGLTSENMNKGCEALLYSELYILKHLENEHRKINVYIIEGNEPLKQEVFNVLGERIPVTVLPEFSYSSLSLILKSIRNLHTLKLYKSLDYVFAIGFGDSFSDIYGSNRFDSINNPIRWCLRKGLKVIFMPQTIGPFKNPETLRKAIFSLNKAAMVFPRDKQSLQFVLENSSNHNVEEMIDVAFFLPYQRVSINTNKIKVGIAISGLLWRNGYTGNNEFGIRSSYKDMILKMLEFFCNEDNVQIILTPHVVSGNALQQDDYELSYQIQQSIGAEKVSISPFFKNPIMAKNYISSLDFFIGSRMHACIAALSSGVPVIPLSYSRKFSGLFVDTLSYPYVVDLTTMDADTTLDYVKRYFYERSTLITPVKQAIDIAEGRKAKLINKLDEIIK